MADYAQGGKGKAKPEYVITFNDDIHTIIVVECKNTAKKHCSVHLNKPGGFAVDGVLYYAKFLKQEYNVIAIAVSGTNVDNMKVDTYYWQQGQEQYSSLKKAKDIILEPKNYIELIRGNKLKKAYSLDEIRNTAIDMHNSLREIKVTEAHKPIFIAGVLIALNDEDFAKSYSMLSSYKLVMQNIQTWNNYSLDYLFDFVKGKRLTKADMLPGNVNFLGAISENNGVREKIATSQYCKPNCITVNYNGSVGEAFNKRIHFGHLMMLTFCMRRIFGN